LDLPKGIAPGWQPLIEITGSGNFYRKTYNDFEERNVIKFLVGDPQNPGSIISSLSMARENARTIRDIIPRESWELINELYLYSRENLQSGLSKRGRYDYLKRIIRGAQTFVGLSDGAMSADAGHEFLCLGRIVERADMTTRIIDVRSASLIPEETSGLLPFENIQWISVLKSLTAYQMYRQHVQARVRRADALRFLLLDDAFPRSVFRCAMLVDESLKELPRSDAPRDAVVRLKKAIKSGDIARMAESNSALHAFIDDLQIELGQVNNEIARTYFHVEESAQAQTQTQSTATA
ncbi:MAG: alpha-E domain-containing protein, partial [Gammaproteobacteria bacterium]|nr:alpha-E domain-containing protein [Gammaproteobacteria bacterium]